MSTVGTSGATSPRALLIVSGGIAAVKSIDLLRGLQKRGWRVRVMLTESAQRFVSSLTFATLSGQNVVSDMFDAEDSLAHINLTRECDLVIVAPATANIISKYSLGIADDFATTTLLANIAPLMLAPAMNPVMWAAPPIVEACQRLRHRGVMLVGPDNGDTACGEQGDGRMSEPSSILQAIDEWQGLRHQRASGEAVTHKGDAPSCSQPLRGRKVVVTSGATRESVDPVRFISNYSTGRQGHAIAAAAAAAGADVLLIRTVSSLPPPEGVNHITVDAAADMLQAVVASLPADVFIGVAAVSDWKVESPKITKQKRGATKQMSLVLVANPDILATVSTGSLRPRLTIGFAAETHNVIEYAQQKLRSKGCDWIVANSVAGEEGAFGNESNTVALIRSDGIAHWQRMAKTDVATALVHEIAQHLNA